MFLQVLASGLTLLALCKLPTLPLQVDVAVLRRIQEGKAQFIVVTCRPTTSRERVIKRFVSDYHAEGVLAVNAIAGMASGLVELNASEPESRIGAALQIADELAKAVLSAEASSLALDSTAKVMTSSSSFQQCPLNHVTISYKILTALW